MNANNYCTAFFLQNGSTFLSGEDMCVQAAPEFLTLGSTCEKSKAHVHAFTTPDNIKYQECFTIIRQTSKES